MITVEYYNKLINYPEDKNFNIKYCTPIIIEKKYKEKCAEIILAENRDVTFYDVFFYEPQNSILFYTDKEINIKGWDNYMRREEPKMSYIDKLKIFINNTAIPKEDEVSLYDVYEVICNSIIKYQEKIDICYQKIKTILKTLNLIDENQRTIKFDEIKIGNYLNECGYFNLRFYYLIFNKDGYVREKSLENNISFEYRNGYTYINSDNTRIYPPEGYDKDAFLSIIMKNISNSLIEMFKLFNENRYLKKKLYNIEPVNFDCVLEIDNLWLKIYKTIDSSKIFDIKFEFNKNKIIQNNTLFLEALDLTLHKEFDLIKKLYVKKELLPEWIQEILKQKEIYETSLINYEEEVKKPFMKLKSIFRK